MVATPSPLRRLDHGKGTRRVVLKPSHSAIVGKTTLFPSTRKRSVDVLRILKSGHNSRKIGKRVTKGKWRGFPIYTLTLTERETCPRACEHWLSCYGNHMPFAERLLPGRRLEQQLWGELETLNARHSEGFVVRLHVLGDFYSRAYVQFWARSLDVFPALHVFGYTARRDAIGAEIRQLAVTRWSRFAVRSSGIDKPEFGAVTIEKGETTQHVVCPAQTGKTECCATCGFCWHSQRTVAFERH